jgi:ArsR family metal-binding transcriptional regulator
VDPNAEEQEAMLLEDFEYQVETSPCDSSANRLRAVATFEGDVSCVFPYLNAEFPDCDYSPQAKVLRLTSGGRVYAIHASRIVTGVRDVSEAQAVLAHVRDVINDTWQRRSEIRPLAEARARPAPFEVFKLLPKTNCGACGEKTCMAFAVKLASGAAELEACVPLEASAREQLEQSVLQS